jgi:hypothetical protein
MAYHKILERQIKKTHTEKYLEDPNLASLFTLISEVYEGFERDNRISEHAFWVSGREYQEALAEISRVNTVVNDSLKLLNEGIKRIKPDSIFNENKLIEETIRYVFNIVRESMQLNDQVKADNELLECLEQFNSITQKAFTQHSNTESACKNMQRFIMEKFNADAVWLTSLDERSTENSIHLFLEASIKGETNNSTQVCVLN